MTTVAHVENPPEQAHVIELNYGGDVKPVVTRTPAARRHSPG